MAPSTVHLPNGQTLVATPVFGGISFKSSDWATHRSAFPPGWTIVLNQEVTSHDRHDSATAGSGNDEEAARARGRGVHRYTKPSLRHDHMFISSISNPSSQEFKPATSQTRQIAMMLWASLWWYFHQPEPDMRLAPRDSSAAPQDGQPRGEWILNVNREGIFKGKNLLAKLERMGLIITEDSSVGASLEDSTGFAGRQMFVSRRAFWQLDARIYLFTLMPIVNSPFAVGSPAPSRPGSPMRDGKDANASDASHEPIPRNALTPNQFQSSSHLPTYYPPHPAQYTFTNGTPHPMRPRPFRQGETFYTRYVPSVGQFLSFRVASLSPKPVSRQGPWTLNNCTTLGLAISKDHPRDSSEPVGATKTANSLLSQDETDVELLARWMNEPRVAKFWGEEGDLAHHEAFLRRNLSSKHSFPAIGCWNGKPFGYFEIYWVKEDELGRYLGGGVGDYDRGIHCLVGEQEFRGPHRVPAWLSSLVHYCWLADMRTNTVMLEPRVDNSKLAAYCMDAGFYKERELAFPHKQASLFKIQRSAWEKPFI